MSWVKSKLAARGIRLRVGVAIVVLLWLVYTTLQTLMTVGTVDQGLYAVVGFIPGILAVGVLLAAGLSREECYLQPAPLSGKGLAVLVAIFVLASATVLPVGVWQGWDWLAALVYAPASGISQELFFRSALLPAMMVLFPGRPGLWLLAHSLLFGLWHIGPLFLGAPLWVVLAIMFVPFVCGIGWGWQVRRDGTVVWAMIQHSLFWVVGLQFTFGA